MRGGGTSESSGILEGHVCFSLHWAKELGFEDLVRGFCENSELWWKVGRPDWKQLWAFDFLEEQKIWCLSGVGGYSRWLPATQTPAKHDCFSNLFRQPGLKQVLDGKEVSLRATSGRSSPMEHSVTESPRQTLGPQSLETHFFFPSEQFGSLGLLNREIASPSSSFMS